MIFKKPYAFFIKKFKLLHLIIFVLTSMLLYKTSMIYSFVNEYLKETPKVLGKEVTDTLFSPWLYILIGIIILINLLIILIMMKKCKPYMYYVVNIILYIGVLVVYAVSNGIINNLEVMLVEAKYTMAIRDILNISKLLQTISIIFYLIRATGFDIKKFDFVKDLQQLDISEEDSEEYEVALEFEKNVAMRNIKKIIRNAKYYYAENKRIINIIILLFISSILLLIYISINKYDKIYKENQFFNVSSLDIGIKESYITNKNYQNDTINEDNKFVILKISAKNYIVEPLQESRMPIEIDNTRYYPVNKYKNSFIDLGNTYNSEKLTNEFQDYLLVYEIPSNKNTTDIIFKYIDNIEYSKGKTKTNSIKVKLSPIKLDEINIEEKTYKQEEQIEELDNIKLSSYDINTRYEHTYNNCISKTECIDFKEIITPQQAPETPKTLLKIKGENLDKLYEYIYNYGILEYTYQDKTYIERNDFNIVNFKKSEDDSIYIEINKEIEEATNIKLKIKIRNKEYIYILRGDIDE